MKLNLYLVAFGIVAVVIILAAISTLFFSQPSQSKNVSLAALPNYGPAPNFEGISGWINSQPLSISQLKGKVVLVDFWTYSCINCIRSIPHVEAWYDAYGNNGLVVVGVSTPEFPFEHNYSNVAAAVKQFGITYPVALDNNYDTWNAYDNHYWPADYVIDANGDVRYVSFGEGDYNQTEQVIRELLVSAGYTIQPNFTDVPLGVNFSGIGSPEMYLGWQFAQEHSEDYLGNSQGFQQNTTVNYTLPSKLEPNLVYLSGQWYDAPDYVQSVGNSAVTLIFKAKSVNIVASGNSTLTISLDNQTLPEDELGFSDTYANGTAIAITGASKLYELANATSYGTYELHFNATPGLKIYTFTFG